MAWIIADSGLSDAWEGFVAKATSDKRLRKWAIHAGFGAAGGILDGERAVDVIQPGFDSRVRVAEWFEKENRANAEFVKNLKVQVAQKLVDRVRSGSSNWTIEDVWLVPLYGYTVTFESLYKTVSSVAESYVDVLKLGQGVLVEKSAKGWFADGLRLLQILPTEAAAQGIKTHLQAKGAQLTQRIPHQPMGGPRECVTNSAARAMALTRRLLFAPVVDLWKKSGTNKTPHEILNIGVYIHEVERALTALGVKTALIRQPTFRQIIAAAEHNPNGAVVFAVEFLDPVSRVRVDAHALVASSVEGRVLVYDTAGQVYRSWAEVQRAYPAFALAPHFEMLIVRGAALMEGVDVAIKHGDGLISALAVQMRYISLATPIIIQAAHEYVEKVALKPAGKPASDKTREQQHQSDKTKPYGEPQGGEPFWREDEGRSVPLETY